MKAILVLIAAALLLVSAGCGLTDEYAEAAPAFAPSSEPKDSSYYTIIAAEASEQAEIRIWEQTREAARVREETIEKAAFALLDAFGENFPAEDFVLWLEEGPFRVYPGEFLEIPDGQDMSAFLRKRTGESIHVLTDRFNGLLDNDATAKAAGIRFAPQSAGDADDAVLAIAGDVNLIDGGTVMNTYKAAGGDLEAIFPDGLLDEMRDADVFMVNNEFAFTGRGAPIPNKDYTFRSKPENVKILAEMGVDAACLANNHIYDFGEIGLLDTLDTLDNAGIARFGAGRDIDDAAAPAYFIVNGLKIAYIGTSCIDITYTRVAGANLPGVLRARENNADKILETIREAYAKSDFVIINLHWGFENTSKVEAYQRQLAKMCIDAGADAIIGGHPHTLQGAEFYNGKPIIYSLGNYWFSKLTVDTALLKLIIDSEGEMTVQFLPCVTSGGRTKPALGENAERILKYYESISFGVSVGMDGVIQPR